MATNQRSSFSQSYASSFFAYGNEAVLVLGADGNLWMEHAVNGKFGTIPPTFRELVDSNVQAFEAIDGSTVLVLGADGNLWMEHAVKQSPTSGTWFGTVPPPRELVDGNVQAFQAIDAKTVFVLGTDGKLWREHANALSGYFGQVPLIREQVDTGAAFQALDANTVFVLDSQGKLYLDQVAILPPAKIAPAAPRESIYQSVAAFQALDANTVFILDTNGNLILTRGVTGSDGKRTWPTSGEWLLGGGVSAFQALDASHLPSGDVSFAVYTLYKQSVFNQPPPVLVKNTFTSSNGKTSLTNHLNVDAQVLDFQAIEPDVVILGSDGNLWLTDGALGTVPPPRKQIDANVQGPLAYGFLKPLYHVLAVLYAPPGTTGGNSKSLADYTKSGGTGSTVSWTHAFKAGIDVKATVGNDAVGSLSADFNYSKTATNTTSVQITKTQTNDLKVPGPATDGIDHDEDWIYLWLNPEVRLALDTQNNLVEVLGTDGGQGNILYVQVGELKNPSSMAAGRKKVLDDAGLSLADYQTILMCDPFAGVPLLTGGWSQPTAIDPNRFTPIDHGPFTYAGPQSAGDSILPQSWTYQLSNIQTTNETTEVSYGVSVTASTGKLVEFFSAQVTGSFQWTNTNSVTDQSTSTQSAMVTIGGASYGYSGPAQITVYWDNIYSSFMFAYT